MAINDHIPPYFSSGAPMWEPDQMPAFIKGLEARKQLARPPRSAEALESFGRSMNAFASIIVPADPDVTGDHAAGDTESFFMQMSLLIRRGTVPELGAEIDEDDARTVFAELDAHARSDFGRPTFAKLAETAQEQLVAALLGGTLNPLTVDGPDAATVLQSTGRLMVIIVKIAYWTNYPEHRVRSGALGFGSGEVIFSDPQNQISNPNIPGTGTAWDYLGWHYPLRKGVEDKVALAFLEADVPDNAAESDTALAELLAKDADRTLINEE